MTCQRSVSIAWEGDDSEKKDMIGSKQHMATNKRPGHLLSEGRQVISFPSGNKTELVYGPDMRAEVHRQACHINRQRGYFGNAARRLSLTTWSYRAGMAQK